MSVRKLSAQQTLGLLIKKRDVSSKRGGCESALPGAATLALLASHTSVESFYKRANGGVLTLLRSSSVGNSPQSFTVTPLSYCRPQEIWLPHEPVCTSCYLHPVSFQQQRPRPGEALSPPRTPWIDNAAVNSSSSWLISQVVTGRAARICWLSKVNGAGPLACSFSPSVWWLARDVRPGASITTARESHFSGRKRLDFTWPQPVALDQHAVVAQSWGSSTVGPVTADSRLVSLHAREFVSQ